MAKTYEIDGHQISKAQADALAAIGKGPLASGGGFDPLGALEKGAADIVDPIARRWEAGAKQTPGASEIAGAFTPAAGSGGTPAATTAKKTTAKKKAAATPATNPIDTAAAELGQLGQALAGENQTLTAQTVQAIQGKVPGETAQTAPPSGAQILAGNTPGGQTNQSAEDWLSSNIAAAQAADSPLQTAMNNYAAAFASGEQGINAALTSGGVDNSAFVATSPEQAYLSLLTPNRYYPLSASQASSLPLPLQYALSQAGIQGITAPKGGWPKSLTGGKTTTNPLAALGTTPSTSAPTALLPGTGAAPS